MPYKVVMDGDKHCVIKSTDGKKMGCHDTHEKALAQMKALYANEAMSTIAWIDPFQYIVGQPFRVFPIGSFKRGDRTIDLTSDRLRQMKENYEAQRPRWKIPIYAGHPTEAQPDPPKLGNVASLDLRSDGLYAVPELTEDGQGLIETGKYQYISPGVLWELANAQYTDENGKEFNNVLDHIALTNKPFFGNQTAIFSSDAELMKENDAVSSLQTGISELIGLFRDFFRVDEPERFKDYDTETRRKMAEKGQAMKDGSYPIADGGDLEDAIHAIGRGKAPHASIRAHIIKRAKAMGMMDKLPEDWKENMMAHSDDDMMPDKKKMKKMEDKRMSDTPVINVEEFNALKAKADELDALKVKADEFAAQLAVEKARADEFATQFTAERKARAIEGLKVRAEKFAVALPIKPDEYAEKFYMLTEKDADLAKWFMAKFDALNTQMAQSALFSQFSCDNIDPTVETISTVTDRILADKFNGDMTKYKDALTEAGKLRPDLADAGLMSPKRR